MNKSELKAFYIENERPFGNELKKSKYNEFKKSLKREFSFISEMGGRKEISIYLHAMMNDITEPPMCCVCGDPIKTAHSREFPKTCSRKCNGTYTMEIQRRENLKNYGVEYNGQREDVKEKARQTSLKKHGTTHHMKSSEGKKNYKAKLLSSKGVENVFQLESVKEKIKSTHLEKRGVDHPARCGKVALKKKETNQRVRGVDNPMQHPDVTKKGRETWLETLGVDNPQKNQSVKEKTRNTNMKKHGHPTYKESLMTEEAHSTLKSPEKLKRMYTAVGISETMRILGVYDSTIYKKLNEYGIDYVGHKITSLEASMKVFLDALGVVYIQNDRQVLGGKEIDFLIPKTNIGIEMNGIYHHSNLRKENRYHLNKTERASKEGIQLIQIFEDEWNYRREQCKNKLKAMLGVDDREKVYARKTTVHSVDKNEAREFLEQNHIQGFAGGFLYKGLYCGTELVAITAFRRSNGECHLNRYATSKWVIGGMSKLVKNSAPEIAAEGYKSIVSFADRRWSTGKMYESAGWELVKTTPPDYQYVRGDKRVRKQNYRRRYLPMKLDFFDPALSESKNMLANGIYKVYDCGLLKYELKFDKLGL